MLSAGKLTESWPFSLVPIDYLWGARLWRAPEQQKLVLVIRPDLSGLASKSSLASARSSRSVSAANTVKFRMIFAPRVN